MIIMFGDEWRRTFSCFDGLEGRPTLEECLKQGINRLARRQCVDMKSYLDNWLKKNMRAIKR